MKNKTHFPALGVCYLLSVKNPFTQSHTFDTTLLLFPFFLVLFGIYSIILYACVQLAMALKIKPSHLYYKVLEKVWYSLAVPWWYYYHPSGLKMHPNNDPIRWITVPKSTTAITSNLNYNLEIIIKFIQVNWLWYSLRSLACSGLFSDSKCCEHSL